MIFYHNESHLDLKNFSDQYFCKSCLLETGLLLATLQLFYSVLRKKEIGLSRLVIALKYKKHKIGTYLENKAATKLLV